ncbi:hypothetical protein KSP40_PGU006621 [Platanthera guangdongensis]|uniref:PB1 domain-containing protein n=1 Tax=Platanthera guangdongensis TaxID=2320717 RepID=A0ABR2M9V5_9ASPA
MPESGDSSPHCRETDGENNVASEETPQQAAGRVKLMCSYGGRIQPRQHDNQLAYFGGETKILAVDRSVRFPAIVAKLVALHGTASADLMRVKYQLPGEDLDSLISITNDEDLEHMMIEYDRLLLSSGKPSARLRLFLFTANRSICLTPPERRRTRRMMIAKDLTPENLAVEPSAVDNTLSSKPDQEEEKPQIAGETVVSPSAEIQRRILTLQIPENQYNPPANMQPHGTDESLARVYNREYYPSGVHDHAPPAPAPAATLFPIPMPTSQIPAGYWADQRGFFGARFTSVAGGGQLPMYLIPASLGLHPSTGRPAYYPSGHHPLPAFPRISPADYRDFQAMYATAPPPQYPEGSAPPAPRASDMDAATAAAAYAAAQAAYDSTVRPVFYPAGVTTFQTVAGAAPNSEPVTTKPPSQIS